jgi:hypothetical protein
VKFFDFVLVFVDFHTHAGHFLPDSRLPRLPCGSGKSLNDSKLFMTHKQKYNCLMIIILAYYQMAAL